MKMSDKQLKETLIIYNNVSFANSLCSETGSEKSSSRTFSNPSRFRLSLLKMRLIILLKKPLWFLE